MKKHPAGPTNRPHLSKDEHRYYGKNACLALWKNRPQDLIRVYVRSDLEQEFKELLQDCAKTRKSFHLVREQDLEKLTDTVHHQGICVVAKERKILNEGDFFRQLKRDENLLLYLDGVSNPHNLGAILRTAAHFGLNYVLIPKGSVVRLAPSANRTSEGGGEFVTLVNVENVQKFFDRLRNESFQVYGFEPSEKSTPLFETRLGEKAVLIMGAEVEGISPLVRSQMHASIRIPGTGAIESLNVSVAAALAMAEFRRQKQERQVRIVKKPS